VCGRARRVRRRTKERGARRVAARRGRIWAGCMLVPAGPHRDSGLRRTPDAPAGAPNVSALGPMPWARIGATRGCRRAAECLGGRPPRALRSRKRPHASAAEHSAALASLGRVLRAPARRHIAAAPPRRAFRDVSPGVPEDRRLWAVGFSRTRLRAALLLQFGRAEEPGPGDARACALARKPARSAAQARAGKGAPRAPSFDGVRVVRPLAQALGNGCNCSQPPALARDSRVHACARLCTDTHTRAQMPPKNQKKDDEAEQLTRIAIIDDQKCKPKKCNQE